jgi:hypothetical protein
MQKKPPHTASLMAGNTLLKNPNSLSCRCCPECLDEGCIHDVVAQRALNA